MADYFIEHQYSFWFTLGFVLLAMEMLLGFSTGFIFFIALAALLSGAAMWFDLIPHSWLSGVAFFSISSVIITALLYKPLKRMQNQNDVVEKDTSSDIIGLEFRLEQAVTTSQVGKKRYSGVDWKVEIDKSANVDTIATGTLVCVVTVDVALFRVKPVIT